MLILGKCKYSVHTLLAVLIIFVSKSTSDKSLQLKNDDSDKSTPGPVISKIQEGNSEEKDNAPSVPEERLDEAIPEKIGKQLNSDGKEENQFEKPEGDDHPSQKLDSGSKQSNVKMEDADQQQSVPQETKVEEDKLEGAKGSQTLAEETKKQNMKLDDNSRKISLSDVNSITLGESNTNQVKRDTRAIEFLGMPRDASYFFDDLEPFINNYSAKEYTQDNSRAARAIPARENKASKAKIGAKKDMIDDEAEEEEDDDDNEKVEEGKASEGDYEDDEDIDPECQPTTDPCTSSTECEPPTTECSPTTTPCPTTPTPCRTTPRYKKTTKCTTKLMCPTKCPTTTDSPKCPKVCAKGNGKPIRYPIAEKTKSWESDEKRTRKRTHSKISPKH